jgi:hypothetical protein
MLAQDLIGDRCTELGGDGVVTADVVDVGGKRRAVEHLSVEVSGEQTKGSEDRAEDDEDTHAGGPHVSACPFGHPSVCCGKLSRKHSVSTKHSDGRGRS